jgi:crotonobetainyl-CoA:carnitine CoA-transferase CaiB-like acyl-CoA transferase
MCVPAGENLTALVSRFSNTRRTCSSSAHAVAAVAARSATGRRFTDHVQRFGVPAAALPAVRPDVAVPWSVTTIASPRSGLRLDGAVVVDLSSLWAGPLCAQLLGRAGATVIKVESTRRPDGARMGDSAFFDWLHAGHQSVAVDFTTAAGRAALADLVRAADVVIEASRPRALANLGLAPEALDHRAGKVWLSITGYGRREPARVAFGDDAAVSGGLVSAGPVFCGDAIADPLTGLHAALTAAESISRGGGELIELSMAAVAATYAELPPQPETCCAAEPTASEPAARLGADNAEVDRLVAERRLASC